MGIGVLQTLGYGVVQAVHFCLGRPIKIRQFVLVVQFIGAAIAGHFHPINTAHILTPSQNLSHKTLHLRNVNFRFSIVIGFQNLIDHFLGRKHLGIH